MTVTIQFLGASGTVTGSKYLVTYKDQKLLIDCGMFQGAREWRDKNWEDPPCDLSEINVALLTHAHIDHTGMLPRFVKLGLQCPVYCTQATQQLTELVLLDSGKLQEEEASYRAERGKSRHHPPLPLYTEDDVKITLRFLKSVQFHARIEVLPGIFAEWKRMGHILGAASIRLEIGGKIINFSGDIGRYDVPILVDPEAVDYGDLLLVESTYGNRTHGTESPKEGLQKVISSTAGRGGVVVIPSFAVGRTQEVLFHIRELKSERRIPDLPIVIDSPMAQDATRIYQKHPQCYDPSTQKLLANGEQPFSCSKLAFVRDRNESIRLNSIDDPMVIISASGMLSGGRILHHLKHRIADPRNTILFVGFQPPGGRGDWIKSGASSLRLLGDDIPIRANVEEISGLSAHGDKNELLHWCRSGAGKPGKVAVVHGEPDSAEAFRATLSKELQWSAVVPSYLQKISI